MYVLAAECRTVLPRDVDTGFPCYLPIEIRFKVGDPSNNKDKKFRSLKGKESRFARLYIFG